MPTVKNWLTALEASDVIIMMLPPWHGNPGKRLVKRPKGYFLETGLMCVLANFHTNPLGGRAATSAREIGTFTGKSFAI